MLCLFKEKPSDSLRWIQVVWSFCWWTQWGRRHLGYVYVLTILYLLLSIRTLYELVACASLCFVTMKFHVLACCWWLLLHHNFMLCDSEGVYESRYFPLLITLELMNVDCSIWVKLCSVYSVKVVTSICTLIHLEHSSDCVRMGSILLPCGT